MRELLLLAIVLVLCVIAIVVHGFAFLARPPNAHDAPLAEMNDRQLESTDPVRSLEHSSEALAKQLGGTLNVTTDRGARCVVRFGGSPSGR